MKTPTTFVIKLSLKGPTIATGAASKWGGVMIKLSGLSPCLLDSQCSILTL